MKIIYFQKNCSKNFLYRFFYFHFSVLMTSIFKHNEKLEMDYFLFGNKYYLKLITGQENSENSEQGKRNID